MKLEPYMAVKQNKFGCFFFIVLGIIFLYIGSKIPHILFNGKYYAVLLFLCLTAACVGYIISGSKIKKKFKPLIKLAPTSYESLKATVADGDSNLSFHYVSEARGSYLSGNSDYFILKTPNGITGKFEEIKVELDNSIIIQKPFNALDQATEYKQNGKSDNVLKSFSEGKSLYVFGELFYNGKEFVFKADPDGKSPLYISNIDKIDLLPIVQKSISKAPVLNIVLGIVGLIFAALYIFLIIVEIKDITFY